MPARAGVPAPARRINAPHSDGQSRARTSGCRVRGGGESERSLPELPGRLTAAQQLKVQGSGARSSDARSRVSSSAAGSALRGGAACIRESSARRGDDHGGTWEASRHVRAHLIFPGCDNDRRSLDAAVAAPPSPVHAPWSAATTGAYAIMSRVSAVCARLVRQGHGLQTAYGACCGLRRPQRSPYAQSA